MKYVVALIVKDKRIYLIIRKKNKETNRAGRKRRIPKLALALPSPASEGKAAQEAGVCRLSSVLAA